MEGKRRKWVNKKVWKEKDVHGRGWKYGRKKNGKSVVGSMEGKYRDMERSAGGNQNRKKGK